MIGTSSGTTIQGNTAKRMGFFFFLPLCLFLPLSCTAPIESLPVDTEPPPEDVRTFRIDPSEISQFGNEWIRLEDLPEPLDPERPVRVLVGDKECNYPEIIDETSLRCLAPGRSEPGRVAVAVVQDEAEQIGYRPLVYTAARDRLFSRMAALGGSAAAGFQNGTLRPEGQLQSVPAWIARQAGAYLPLPLVVQEGIPAGIGLEDVLPSTALLDPEAVRQALEPYRSGEIPLENLVLANLGRTTDLGIPGLQGVPPLLEGFDPDDPSALYERLIRYPDDPEESRVLIDQAAAMSPQVLVITHEILEYPLREGASFIGRDWIERDVNLLFEWLRRFPSAPWVFLVNRPPGNLAPHRDFSEWRRYQAIWANNALAAAVGRANALLDGPPRFHVVDIYGLFVDWLEAGTRHEMFGQTFRVQAGENGEPDLRVDLPDGGSDVLGFDRNEGLFSLDGETFTRTGMALLANAVLWRINKTMGPEGEIPTLAQPVQLIDIAEVLMNDPYSMHGIRIALSEMDQPPFGSPDLYADPDGLEPLRDAHRCAINWNDSIGLRESECPAGLILQNGNAQSFPVSPGQDHSLVLRLLDENNRPVGVENIAGMALDGTLEKERVKTDSNGQATFRYRPPDAGEDDRVRFICGEAMLDVTLSIQR